MTYNNLQLNNLVVIYTRLIFDTDRIDGSLKAINNYGLKSDTPKTTVSINPIQDGRNIFRQRLSFRLDIVLLKILEMC